MYKWIAVVVVILAFVFIRQGKNNVCKTFDDYYSNRDSNENCYYNPDHELTVPRIVERHGYPVETHRVTTEDGYILTIFRIPHGKDSNNTGKPGKPVLLNHGITINSGVFVNKGKKSFGFVLADAGYDVWLGNFRGTIYSRNHTKFHASDSRFWNFSFHENGVYDAAAQLKYITALTKQKVIYTGFSMGSTASYVYSSMYPEVAKKQIERIISLAPIAFMKDIKPFADISRFWPLVESLFQFLTKGQITPRPFLPSIAFSIVCLPFPIQMRVCQIPDMWAFGHNYDQNDPETLPVTLQHNKDSTSIKTIAHYTHLLKSGNFHFFDYGAEENKKVYGSEKPPHYDLSRINIPILMVVAQNDLLSTKENIATLQNQLPKLREPHETYIIKDVNFNHLDFLTGKDSHMLVYNPIVEYLKSR